MVIRSRAPVRIDFAGGTTDLSPFRDEIGGAVVNATISRYAYCTLTPLDNHAIRITSENLQTFVEAQDIRELEYDGNLDLLKAAVRRLNLDIGLNIIVHSDAPPGSGVGTSASVGVALIGMLERLQREMDRKARAMTAHEIAELACQMESELGIVGGKQDQYAAALGGINFMEFFSEGRVSVQHLEIDRDTLYELEKHLVLCYTGESRLSGDTNQKMIQAYRDGVPEVVDALKAIRQVAYDVKQALLLGDLKAFAELLEEEYQQRVKLAPSVVTRKILYLRDLALEAGAVSMKICGAGGGGCVLFYCRPDMETRVKRVLQQEGGTVLDFAFDHRGLQVWKARATADE
jgi:D-glycero-alpha-D-manno-heptose-7-phosphate kinase